MRGRACSLGWLIALALLLGASPAPAQDEPFRARGTIASVDAGGLVVETRAGEVMGFALDNDSAVFRVSSAALEDVEEGAYVGLTSIEADGRRVALEAHVFAEDLRGLAEGHFPWDLVDEPNTMTNATIAEIAEVGAKRELELVYEEDGEQGMQTIHLPPDVPIVRLEKADRTALEPGRQVFLMVQGPRDGIPKVNAAVVGTEGAAPPM